MTRLSRLLVACAALALLPMYALPIWRISLIAPQYPEGIGMYIRLSTVQGIKEHDLENINQLNHYIGMKVIDPAAIPELSWMPWIVAGLVASGLIVAITARRRLLYAWFAVFALIAAAGLGDFWRWTWDFGHNLDIENAIIKVPGMVYQPPIIGTKQILNFHASSWPTWGGAAAFVAMALAIIAVSMEARRSRFERVSKPLELRRASVVAALLMIVSLGCRTSEPPRLAYDGTESCDVCRMAVTDKRFAAALVSATGKTLRFDSIECLAAYHAQLLAAGQTDFTPWVTDFLHPGTLIRADSAHFIQSDERASPMGKGLLALRATTNAKPLQEELHGRLLDWSGVLHLAGTGTTPERRETHAHAP